MVLVWLYHGKNVKPNISQDSPLLEYMTEKAMAPHSSTLAWKIPWMEVPGRLQSMGSLSRTRLSDFTFTFHFHALDKEMATHSSVLAWRIPGMGEPGRLPSVGSHRVGHDWSDLAAEYMNAARGIWVKGLQSGLQALWEACKDIHWGARRKHSTLYFYFFYFKISFFTFALQCSYTL